MIKNYYVILGLSEKCVAADVKKAYRKLAVQYHPDKNNGNKESEEKFKEISDAYQVLIDSDKRKLFDLQLERSRKPEFERNMRSSFENFKNSEFANKAKEKVRKTATSFADFFLNRTTGPDLDRKKSIFPDFNELIESLDAHFILDISPMEYYYGCQKKIRYEVVSETMRFFFPEIPVYEEKIITIQPKSTRLIYPGEGYYINYLYRSNLIIKIRQTSQNSYIEGNDLHVYCQITHEELLTGKRVSIKSPSTGKSIVVTIKPNTNPETTLRITGKGMHDVETNQTGNIYIHFKLEHHDNLIN